MALGQPTIRSGVLAEFRRYLSRRGLRLDALAAEAGLLPGPHEDPVRPVPLNATMMLFDLAARALKDPALGIDFARELRPGGTGLIGEIVLTAPTVRLALGSAAGLIRVFMSPFDIAFSETGGVGELEWRYPSTATAPRVHYNMFMVSVLVLRLRGAAGPDWVPLLCELEHTAPDCPGQIRSVLGTRVRFNAARNCLSLDAPTLGRAMPGANPIRFAIMRDLAERWLAEEPIRPEIVVLVRAAVAAMLKSQQAELEAVARRLGLTPGALQWRLEQAGTTFERVVADERMSQARSLLHDTDRSVTEIAFDLGFSDPSAFTRAARRWFNMSPRDYRRSSRKAPD